MAQTDPSGRWPAGRSAGSPRLEPGSLLVAAVLLLLAGMLVVAGLEATDPSTPVTLAPADVAASTALGNRTYSTIHGALSSTYAEYFSDDNGNGTEDEGEETIVWYYWLIDRDARAGVTVRSTRPPEALFRFHGTGILVDEPRYPREVYDEYGDEASRAGLTIEPAVVLDTTSGPVGSADADLPGRPAAADRHSRRADRRPTRVVRRGLLARSERRQGVRFRRAGPVRGARLRPGLPARHQGAGS